MWEIWAVDGLWKLVYPICMYCSPKQISAFKGQLNYVDNRPEQLANGKAFCENHCRVAEENGVPSGLQEFLKHCGIAKDPEGKASGIDEQKIDRTCEDLTGGKL